MTTTDTSFGKGGLGAANPISQLGNVTTESAFPASIGGTTRLVLSAEDFQLAFDGSPFKIQALFLATSGTTSNFTGKIYWNANVNTNLTTFTSDVNIVTSGTQALASSSGEILLEAICLWDSVSQQLAGFYPAGGLANIPTTPAVIKASATIAATNPITTGLTKPSLLQFFATGLFGTSNASNVAKLIGFTIDRY